MCWHVWLTRAPNINNSNVHLTDSVAVRVLGICRAVVRGRVVMICVVTVHLLSNAHIRVVEFLLLYDMGIARANVLLVVNVLDRVPVIVRVHMHARVFFVVDGAVVGVVVAVDCRQSGDGSVPRDDRCNQTNNELPLRLLLFDVKALWSDDPIEGNYAANMAT